MEVKASLDFSFKISLHILFRASLDAGVISTDVMLMLILKYLFFKRNSLSVQSKPNFSTFRKLCKKTLRATNAVFKVVIAILKFFILMGYISNLLSVGFLVNKYLG